MFNIDFFVYQTPDQFKFDLSILKASDYFVGYAFDAVLVLTSAFEKLHYCPNQFHIDSIWHQTCWRKELINIIQTLDIQGVTGRIRFNNGDRIGEIVIEQILGRRKKYIFNYHRNFVF